MEDGKEVFLLNEMNHDNFYRISQHSDFCNAATALLARFLSAKAPATADDHFFGKSSQVPFHE